MVLPVETLFLLQFEVDEVLDLFLGRGRQALVLPGDLGFPGFPGPGDFLVKKLRDIHLEDREDLKQGFEADLVFAVLHPAQVGLLDADATREVGLGESPILPKCSNSGPDEQRLLFEF